MHVNVYPSEEYDFSENGDAEKIIKFRSGLAFLVDEGGSYSSTTGGPYASHREAIEDAVVYAYHR